MRKQLSFAERLKKGMREAISFEKGEIELRTRTVELPEPPRVYTADDIQALRHRFGHSQTTFAQVLGVAVNTVQSWEQSARTPTGSAARLLQLLEQPEQLERLRSCGRRQAAL